MDTSDPPTSPARAGPGAHCHTVRRRIENLRANADRVPSGHPSEAMRLTADALESPLPNPVRPRGHARPLGDGRRR